MDPSARFFRLEQLQQLRRSEQVAAICYRVRNRSVEFLLVQTRSRRWTFPKGGAEPHLTNAQTAALEAFEEAGVHGRMEKAPFARYAHRKRGGDRELPVETVVSAFLCEVLWRDSPPEAGRNPTWFSPEKAKRRLQARRTLEYGAELGDVVDRAVSRIEQLHRAVHRG